MASSGGGILWDDRELLLQLKTFDARVDRAITVAVAYHATQGLSWARINAPWRDRTTNARNGLFARVERGGGTYRIIFGHGVPYGVWLEVRWAGRYQIIRPTVDHEGPELMKTVSMLYSAMSRGGA